MDLFNVLDPYVKIYLMYENRRVEKVKTTCKPVTLNPTFDESFTFRVPPNKMDDTHLVITVMDRDQFKWNEKIGNQNAHFIKFFFSNEVGSNYVSPVVDFMHFRRNTNSPSDSFFFVWKFDTFRPQ